MNNMMRKSVQNNILKNSLVEDRSEYKRFYKNLNKPVSRRQDKGLKH